MNRLALEPKEVMMIRTNRKTVALVCTAVLALGVSRAWPQEGSDRLPEPKASSTVTTSVKVPTTAADHRAIASAYRQELAGHRAEAALHRKMKTDYRKRVFVSPKGPENQLLKKMEKHCDGLIAEAKRRGEHAERFAQYHEMRAEELEGYPLEMFGAVSTERVAETRADERDGR